MCVCLCMNFVCVLCCVVCILCVFVQMYNMLNGYYFLDSTAVFKMDASSRNYYPANHPIENPLLNASAHGARVQYRLVLSPKASTWTTTNQ